MVVRIAVIDTETGGLSPRRDALLEIGCICADINWEGNIVELDNYKVLINPGTRLMVGSEALKVNHLNWQMLLDEGVSEQVAIDGLDKFLSRFSYQGQWPVLVGWNIHFDLAFLKWAFRRSERLWSGKDYKALDIKSLWCYYNLVNKGVSNYGGITHAYRELSGGEIPHRAVDDARATLEMFRLFTAGV